jgi:orotate phosphoribosyltransferase
VLVGAGLLEALRGVAFDCVGGLTLGADPVIAAALAAAGQQGRSLRGFIVRKEAKQHGSKQLIEGPLQAGDRAVVVEDVTTTGGSALQAIAAAEAAGAKVVAVATVLDRQAGAADKFAALGLPFFPLVTLRDLGL